MTSSPPGKNAHTIADHGFGEDQYHSHDSDDADHDHDDFTAGGPIEDNPIWQQDHLSLLSVGIDIGSAGTQIVFSRLHLRRLGEDLSSRYFVVSRETLHQSPVALTPYSSEVRIDDRALGAIIDAAYAAAGVHPDNVDTGVVILTGEALRRENAQTIAELLADQVGEFVCATAGHHMEAMLAAYGSGAAKVSHDRCARLLNVDIGGGTTKLAVIEQGSVVATAAIHVGGRLLVTDANRRIVRLDPAGRYLAAQAGFSWQLGDIAAPADVEIVAAWMADALILALSGGALPPAIERLYLTDPIAEPGNIDGIMFSGGVAEYIYGRESRDFGDWGPALGAAMRKAADAGRLPASILPAGECIRATALGASEYSVQLSGNTTYISNPGGLLPRRNLQVLRPAYDLGERIDADALADAIRAHFVRFDLIVGAADVALAFHWRGSPTYERFAAFARGLMQGLADAIARGKPIYLILDGDVAHTVGALLKEDFGVESDVLAIDGITLWDFDYIDLGRIRLPSNTVPVTIKSLVFSEDPRAPHAPAHLSEPAPPEGAPPAYRQRVHGPHHHPHQRHHGHDHEHPHDDGHGHDHEHPHDDGHDHDHPHDHEDGATPR